MIHLPRSAASLASLVSSEQLRYAMSNVRVRELPESWFRLEATDGRVLAILRGPSSPSPADLKRDAELPTPESLAMEALIAAPEFKAAFRSLPPGKAGDGRTVGVLLGNPVLLSAGKCSASVEPGGGRFPDVDSALPTKPARVSIAIDPDLLVSLLRVASAVSKATGDAPRVELLFWGKNKPFGVKTRGADGVLFDGLVMPLT